MNMLALYLIIYTVIQSVELLLSVLNYRHATTAKHQSKAANALGTSPAKMTKMTAYFKDRAHFKFFATGFNFALVILFLNCGGFTYVEAAALYLGGAGGGDILTGLIFFGLLWLGTTLLGLPFKYYQQFVIEARHGFNASTKKLFWLDQIKGIAIALPIACAVFAVLLLVIQNTQMWWLWAWLFYIALILVSLWFVPTVLSPLFNKFEPIDATTGDGSLFQAIEAVTTKINFPLKDVKQMNASIRSTHGNAYFSGLFKKKQIVFYDNLIKLLNTQEIIAVLAHELGHYKLHHVRNQLLTALAFSGVVFYLMWLMVDSPQLAMDFGLAQGSAYASLLFIIIFTSSVIMPLKVPLDSALSRRKEFAADEFAAGLAPAEDLVQGLIKLIEDSHATPVVHPLFSRYYHSHPPIIERVGALRAHAGAHS